MPSRRCERVPALLARVRTRWRAGVLTGSDWFSREGGAAEKLAVGENRLALARPIAFR
jgi:hypothetical protein